MIFKDDLKSSFIFLIMCGGLCFANIKLNPTGNVGIGTSNPQHTLDVVGEISCIANGTTYYMIPSGVVCMYSGSTATIPSGWTLCDGNNGTPNMLGRFVMSVSTGENNYVEGNDFSTSIVLTSDQLPAHTHTFVSGTESAAHSHYSNFSTQGVNLNHYHYVSGAIGTESANHVHTDGGGRSPICTYNNGTYGYMCNAAWWSTVSIHPSTNWESATHVHTFNISSGGASSNHLHSLYGNTGTVSNYHTHSGTSDSSGSSAGISRPAYYKTAFIMKK